MKETINVGDIVCYSCNNRLVVGKVARISVGRGTYFVVPIEEGKGHYAKTRKINELMTAHRLSRLAENAKYVK